MLTGTLGYRVLSQGFLGEPASGKILFLRFRLKIRYIRNPATTLANDCQSLDGYADEKA